MVPLAKKWIFKNQRFVKLESMKTWIYGFVMLTGNEWNQWPGPHSGRMEMVPSQVQIQTLLFLSCIILGSPPSPETFIS